MERLLHKFFKGKIPKLKDMANEGIDFAKKRKEAKQAGVKIFLNVALHPPASGEFDFCCVHVCECAAQCAYIDIQVIYAHVQYAWLQKYVRFNSTVQDSVLLCVCVRVRVFVCIRLITHAAPTCELHLETIKYFSKLSMTLN